MPHYITHEEYSQDQAAQKVTADAERDSIHRDIAQVRADVSGLSADVREVKTEVRALNTQFIASTDYSKAKFSVIEARFDSNYARHDKTDEILGEIRRDHANFKKELAELRAETSRSAAVSQNSRLRNPILPIKPLVVYDPEKCKVNMPDLKLFPKNANDFYALQNPKTERHRRMLVYLANFYDITFDTALSDGDSHADDDDDAVIIKHPHLVLELLGNLLGLNEDNFIQFRERARHWDAQATSQPIKRSHFAPPSDPAALAAQRPRLEVRLRQEDWNQPDEWPKPKSEGSSGPRDRLMWGTRSTPSSQRQTVNGLWKVFREQREQHEQLLGQAGASSDTGDSREQQREQEQDEPSTDAGSKTNTNTPRDPAP